MSASYDIDSTSEVEAALTSTEIVSNTTTNGEIIDGALREGLEFIVQAGEITDGVYAISLEHGDDPALADAAAVPAADIVGSIADFVLTDDDAVRKFGYIGNKRYVRLVVTSTGVTSGGWLAAVAFSTPLRHNP